MVAKTINFYPVGSKFQNIKKVIKSCETVGQLYSAKNYVNNALNSGYIDSDMHNELTIELQIQIRTVNN